MEIFFCDVCNESIPLQDLRDSRATTLRGRLTCRRCKDLAASEVVPAPAGRSRRASRLGYAVLALIGVGALALLLVRDRAGTAARERIEAAGREVRSRVATVETRLALLIETLDAVRRDQIAQGETARATAQSLSGLREEIAAAGERSTALAASVARLREPLARLSRALSTEDPALADLRDEVADLARRLDGLDVALQAHERQQTLAAAKKTLTRREVLRLEELEKRLVSKDTDTRFEAVYEVLDDKLEEALPFVVPLIADRDQFVQVGAIKTVGALGWEAALPALVAVLADDDVSVREEALRQLVVLSGRADLRFDVRAPARERARAIEAWRRWLAERS